MSKYATSQVVGFAMEPNIAAHARLLHGLPKSRLEHFLGDSGLSDEQVAAVLGISTRTLQRIKASSDKLLGSSESDKLWQLEGVFAKAVQVLGDKKAARAWMVQPVMGLDGLMPIDLLRTSVGHGLVRDFLGRLEYGVYA